ncbi:MAG: type 1 glutamine amidotransferase [Pseudomonadales bacterium]|jgi:type 1 glutamine amidotransferase
MVLSVLKKILLGLAGLLVFVIIALGGVVTFVQYELGLIGTPAHDTQAPEIGDIQRPAILVLDKTNGFVHTEALPAASAMFDELAKVNGWNIYQTDNAASHNAVDLAKFDVVIWNNTSGDILTDEQREDFKAWMLAGGSWLGVHAAGGDFSYRWDWYVDELLGVQFIGHTIDPQFQTADILVEDSASPLTSHLSGRWNVENEEWYAFDRNASLVGAKVLMSMDESTYKTQQAVAPGVMASTDIAKILFMVATMEGEHPIAWSNGIGNGKMIYSGIGHTAATYQLPEYREFITRAVNSLIDP